LFLLLLLVLLLLLLLLVLHVYVLQLRHPSEPDDCGSEGEERFCVGAGVAA
jgi:hypothetical protein